MSEEPITPEDLFAAALDELVGVVKPCCFIRRADKDILAPKSIDMKYNRLVSQIDGVPAKYKDNAAKYAIASPGMEVVDTICYRPDGAPIINDTLSRFNMWSDPGIEPLAGEPTIFLEHLDYLIPNRRERRLLLSWLAHIVQHPDEKVMWAILIIGLGGTGKSWLGYLMERIFGKDNVVLLSEESAATEMFNGFSENKRLVFLHETPPKKMADLLDKLKGLITETITHIRRLHIERYKADNFANLLGISNEAVKVNRTNRRWGVLRAADDPYAPEHTPEHATYYKRLFGVVPKDGSITDELRRILHYLRTFDLTKPLVKGSAEKFDPLVAPLTGTKEEAAESGDDGLVQARVSNAYRDRDGPFAFNLLHSGAVAKHVGRANDVTLTDAMQDIGCRKLRTSKGRDVQVTIDGERVRLWAINQAVAKHHANTDGQDLVTIYKNERAGKPTVEPMAPPERDVWDTDEDFGEEATRH